MWKRNKEGECKKYMAINKVKNILIILVYNIFNTLHNSYLFIFVLYYEN